MMPKSPQPRYLDIFGDESSQQDKFLVYGTMSCEKEETPPIEKQLMEALGARRSEVKWNKLSDLVTYQNFVAAIFDAFRKTSLRYRCVVINRGEADDDQYSGGDADLALVKYVHRLLFTCARNHPRGEPHFFVHLDDRSATHSLESLRQYLNRQDKAEHGRQYEAFDAINSVDSSAHRLIQAADILTGAIAYVANKRHLAKGAAADRLALATFIAHKAQLPPSTQLKAMGIGFGHLETLGVSTIKPVALKGVGIWHLDWKAQHEKAMRDLGKEQLALLPPRMLFGELKAWGFQVDVVCSRCDRHRKDFLRDNNDLYCRRIDSKPRLPCMKRTCRTDGVILLRPDPFTVPLVVEQMRNAPSSIGARRT